MKKHLRKILWSAITIAASLLTILNMGFMPWAESMSFLLTWYFITIGLIQFSLWLPRYRSVKRIERKGLLYLALVQERFGSTK